MFQYSTTLTDFFSVSSTIFFSSFIRKAKKKNYLIIRTLNHLKTSPCNIRLLQGDIFLLKEQTFTVRTS